MATEAQILANRRNAQKSTGPRTTPVPGNVEGNYEPRTNLCKTNPISEKKK